MGISNKGSLEIYRPIQYLGSKIRSVSQINDAVDSFGGECETALDLFSGSTVVAQAMKNKGMKVIANDALKFSSHMATALIADVNSSRSLFELQQLFDEIESNSNCIFFNDLYYEELDAISSADFETLIRHNQKTLLDWEESRLDWINSYNVKIKNNNISMMLYAGTYFGFAQARHIDLIKNKIFDLSAKNIINNYEFSLLITSLLSVMSQSVFSAGKHFAQPHLIKTEENLNFISKRIVQDRSIDIYSNFLKKIVEITEYRKLNSNNGSFSINETFESLLKKPEIADIDLIYVDPPYTAQQYSRFYHIPEVIASNKFPDLQIHKGKVTKGLYPVDRYKSRFCSKTEAPKAFEDVFLLAEKLNSSLVISYSQSKKKNTGNQRMISLEELMKLAKRYYGNNVDLVEFNHTYRQFNKTSSIVDGKEDTEVQIVCKRNTNVK